MALGKPQRQQRIAFAKALRQTAEFWRVSRQVCEFTHAWSRQAGRQVYHRVLDLLIPPACYRCNLSMPARPAGERDLWCARCAREIGLSAFPSQVAAYQCQRCAAQLSSVSAAQRTASSGCANCFEHQPAPASVVALGDYHGGFRRWVIDAKRYPDAVLLAGLAQGLAQRIELSPSLQEIDLVVPVPSRGAWSIDGRWLKRQIIWRLKQRLEGRNVLPERLAERLANTLGLPLATDLVQYRRFVHKQGKLDRVARRRNVAGAMVLCSFGRFRSTRSEETVRISPQIAGKSILVVDDVATSGATLSELTRVMLEAGARQVHAAVLARAAAPK